MSLPLDYFEHVYAGVLGKIIGVYLGRPFEQWSYSRIDAELGEIRYYVHEKLNAPLVVTDDDISGTFTFLRALPDYGNSREITPAQIGQTWLNYIIENRTILWWGGMGHSTEHTAYLRLKQGIAAPESGSMARNSKTVAEQIGSQIFIDGWGMVAPGDPELAADLARRAGSVSHDGEAIYGAQVVAAMEAQAFVESDISRLLDTGMSVIPGDSTIYRLIADLREWYAGEKDWRKNYRRVAERYGYDKFGGGCHIVPNHALIILALLHGEGDFSRSLTIVNTCGWDTDCNSANVGCLLGIRNGLAGIDAGADWRTPVADRMYLPTADGGRCITDAVQEAQRIVAIGQTWAGVEPTKPKRGARFHFELSGSVQGFQIEDSTEVRGTAHLENVGGHSEAGTRSLALRFQHLATGRAARAATATFIPPDALSRGGYELIASPTLYSGQTVRARLSADVTHTRPVVVRLYIRHYDAEDKLTRVEGEAATLAAGDSRTFQWELPDTGGHPIAEIGVEVRSEERVDGAVYLDYLTWDGAPRVSLRKPEKGGIWRRAWVNGLDHFESWHEAYNVIQNTGTGLLIQGTREWTDYRATAALVPFFFASGGIAARVQGMRRYYALLLVPGGTVCLVKALDGIQTLAETARAWEFERRLTLGLQVQGSRIIGTVDGETVFDVTDTDRPLTGGAVAYIVEEGRLLSETMRVEPI